MTRRFFRLRLPCALAALALLAACSVLPKPQNVQLWQPEETASTAATPTADFSLRIETPDTGDVLGGTGIVVMPAPGEVSTYQGARWSEAPADLVQQRLVDAFMAAKLPAVTTDADHLRSDYTLGGSLRAFQSEYRAGSPVVVVRFDAQLRRGFSHSLLATRSFVVTATPTGVGVPQVVAAFGRADDELASQVVAWTIATANRDQAAHPVDPTPTRGR